MKKLTLIVAVLGLGAFSGFPQAQFTVVNNNTDLVYTNGGSGGLGLAHASTTDIKVQLYYQPGNLPEPAPIDLNTLNFGNWEPMVGSPIISIYPVAGKFNGGTESTGIDVAPSGQVWMEMIGWNGGYSSFQAALAAGSPDLIYGVSGEWNQLGGSGAPGTPATIFGANQFPGLILGTPEPSIMALGGLGAGALLLLRRKK